MKPSGIFHRREKIVLHAAIWIAAILVGLAAVLYARVISWSQEIYFHLFSDHPYLTSGMTPVLFILATGLVHFFAKEAKGSGIPQVLEAIELAQDPLHRHEIWLHRLVSLKTASIKVFSSVIGIFAGASIGREGPTVQIASSVFAWVGSRVKKVYPKVDFPSFITTGAAAGVAAAFNTPLAGITFALEEVAEGAFGPFKQWVILGVVIAGVTAQAFSGDYLYFGHPNIPTPNLISILLEAVPIAIITGFFGGVFAKLLSSLKIFPTPKHWWIRAFILGTVCALIGLFTHGDTAGSGYEVTRKGLDAAATGAGLYFPVLKIITTVASYLSGMAGGIFSPCLSIGAGFGFSIANIAHFSQSDACALIGMVAFFSGVVQAPLTAVVIVTEMTDQHALILPFMASAYLAQALGKILMPIPLYRLLATRTEPGK